MKIPVKNKTTSNALLKIAPFKSHSRHTHPHKHQNYFEIVYLTKGSGTHTIDDTVYPIQPPILFTIRKEQVHCWNMDSTPEGYVLILKKALIDQSLDLGIKPLIATLSEQACLFPKDLTTTPFFRLLYDEYRTNQQQIIIDGLLKALLAKILQATTPHPSKNPKNSIVQRYLELLRNENDWSIKVRHYADLLHTSPQNLNAICRKEYQQSASQLLSQHLINEAKRLLIYTDHTVSEIAHKVGFKDNSHFSKYFKKQVGIPPVGYRNSRH